MAVNMLLSYAFDDVRRNLATYRAQMPCGRLMVDSGAFTAWSVGQAIKLADYAAFLADHVGHWDTAVTLDVIGDPVATRRNTQHLHSRGIPVLPVFTRGGTVAEFDAMVRDSGYVCVGGGVGMPPKVVVARLAALQRRAEQLGGGIHALGVGGLSGIRQIRPYSADASNISSVFRYGRVAYYDGRKITSLVLASEHKKLRDNLVHLKAAGLDMATLTRTRRLPKGGGGVERRLLMRGMSVAYSCADEDATRLNVPVPRGVRDTPGTHMFSAVTGGHLAPAVAELDQLMHDGQWSVPLWERYRERHQVQCRARVTSAEGAA